MHELSARELQWERQMQEVKAWIEDNPYRALFGASEERLKGIVHNGWKSHWDPMNGRLKRTRENMEVLNKVVRGEALDLDNEPSKIVYGRFKDGDSQGRAVDATKTRESFETSTAPARSSATVEAEGYWSAYTNNNGKISEASGKLRYDPITMRLVPDESKNDTLPEQMPSKDQWPKKVAVVQDPINFTTDTPNAAALSPSPVKVVDRSSLKEKLEKSFAEARKSVKTRSEEINKTPIMKTASDDMAAAWRKERAGSVQAADKMTSENTSTLDSVFAQTKSSLETAWTAEKENSNAYSVKTNSPHYLGNSKPLLSHEAQMASMSLQKKDKPLRHMRGWELGQHKANLLASWSKKSEEAKANQSQEHLNREVQKQKTAFAAHEGKWRLRDSTSPRPVTASATSSHAVFRPADAVVDENKVREREDANALVRNVREIYETVYGVIDANHRQGVVKAASSMVNVSATDPRTSQKESETATSEEIDDAMSEYDRKMGSSGYDFKTGQDNLEEEVKNKGVSDALKPTAEEPKSKQYKLSDIVKKTTTTKMSSINPIDGTTRPRTFAEYMDAQTFSPTGFSSPDHFPYLQEHQPPVEQEDDVKVSAPSTDVIDTAASLKTSDDLKASSAKSEIPQTATQSEQRPWTPTEEAESRNTEPPNDKKPRKWSSVEEALLGDIHSKGVSMEDLAGIRRLRRWTSAETATLQRLHEQGLTVRDVAALSTNPQEWTQEETNQLTMVLAQNLPSAYRRAAEDVMELRRLYEKGLSSSDVIATKRLSKWSAKELALLQKLSVSDIMILDKERQDKLSASTSMQANANNRIVRKQETVFSGGPINATTSTFEAGNSAEPRINKRRKRSAKSFTDVSNEIPLASSVENVTRGEAASRYPSSFLHSTRTYMPTGSLFNSGNSNGKRSGPPTQNTGSTTGGGNGEPSKWAFRLQCASVFAVSWYVTGVVTEHLRSAYSAPTQSTPTTDATAAAPGSKTSNVTSTSLASRTHDDVDSANCAVASPKAAVVKAEDTYIEAAKKEYQRNAWGDELLAKRDAGLAATTTGSNVVARSDIAPAAKMPVTQSAREDKAGTRVVPLVTGIAQAKADAPEGSGGGMEGLAALGAGVFAAVCVLLGGFGGS